MILKYGEEKGKEKWNEYCVKQSYAGSSEKYFIEKYGEEKGKEKWNEVNKRKAINLKNFIEKYGEKDGVIRYELWLSRCNDYYSKSSQKVFWEIYERLDDELKDKCYFAELNKEFGKHNGEQYFKYDFVISSIKYCIEYNGIHYHAKPELYEENDTVIHIKGKPKKVSEIWEKDEIKINLLTNQGWCVRIIWDDEEYEIDEILKDINERKQIK